MLPRSNVKTQRLEVYADKRLADGTRVPLGLIGGQDADALADTLMNLDIERRHGRRKARIARLYCRAISIRLMRAISNTLMRIRHGSRNT